LRNSTLDPYNISGQFADQTIVTSTPFQYPSNPKEYRPEDKITFPIQPFTENAINKNLENTFINCRYNNLNSTLQTNIITKRKIEDSYPIERNEDSERYLEINR